MDHYAAISLAEYRQTREHRRLTLHPVRNDGVLELFFAEDREACVEKITQQPDQDDPEGYRYAVLIEFGIPGELIREIMLDPRHGRIALPLRAAMANAGVRGNHDWVVEQPDELDVLILTGVERSDKSQAGDGMAQRYLIRAHADGTLWKRFVDSVDGIAALGGVGGIVSHLG